LTTAGAAGRRLGQFPSVTGRAAEIAQRLDHPMARLGQLVRHRARQPVDPARRRADRPSPGARVASRSIAGSGVSV
jgi:hypothetical protein